MTVQLLMPDEPDPSDMVQSDGCPACDERRVAWLIRLEDGQIQCENCGTVYHPTDDTPYFVDAE